MCVGGEAVQTRGVSWQATAKRCNATAMQCDSQQEARISNPVAMVETRVVC